MSERWIDTSRVTNQLEQYFTTHGATISEFGRTVNQTFEAFVFAQVIRLYQSQGWTVALVHPSGSRLVRLKFSTRGRPDSYTYARCHKGRFAIQIRHALRVATRHHRPRQAFRANIVLDVAVIADLNLSDLSTNDHVPNRRLRTFGEAKHMSAFAELLASFVGLVHEMMPEKIVTRTNKAATLRRGLHPHPFLYVSGHLYPTARGIKETFVRRGLAIQVYDQTSIFSDTGTLPTRPAPQRARHRAARPRSRLREP